MPLRESEALILRSYPFREADLIVSFFARDRGKVRGIAKGVRRPKSRFGAGLERLSHSRVSYFEKQTVELTRIDRAELIGPPLTMRADYTVSLALDYFAEVADAMLPDHEPHDAYFRLLTLMLDTFWQGVQRESPKSGAEQGWLWQAVTYFSLWSLRLGGWLPPLQVCLETGVEFAPEETAYFDRSHSGLISKDLKTADSLALSAASRALAGEMLRKPVTALDPETWTRATAADLRRFLRQRLEYHLEKRVLSLQLLDRLD